MKNCLSLAFIIVSVFSGLVNGYYRETELQDDNVGTKDDFKHKPREGFSKDDEKEWPGRWMPARPGDPTPPPKVIHKTGQFKDPNDKENSHVVTMGAHGGCDDGESNLRVDWDLSPINHTCYDKKITPSYSIKPFIYCEHIPSSYIPIHRCMSKTIEYDEDIPIYGTHRPVWPVYGEYKFIPRQRWLHSLEHGAIVMLYHPCANPLEVQRLKNLVTGCLRRHIITPYTLLDEKRPLALVSWGCRLTMSYVNPTVVQEFITTKALHGEEQVFSDGGFEEFLTTKAKTVSDKRDTILCPDVKSNSNN